VKGAYIQSMRRLEGSIAQDEKEAWKARFHELCQSFTTDRRAFTEGLKALTHGATKRSTTTTIAVRDEHGRVRVTPVKALEITRSYWSGIAQEANPKSLGEWEANLPLPKAVGLSRMDEEIGTSEVEEAIKNTKAGKAAGLDGIPPELLKAALVKRKDPDTGEETDSPLLNALVRLSNGRLPGRCNRGSRRRGRELESPILFNTVKPFVIFCSCTTSYSQPSGLPNHPLLEFGTSCHDIVSCLF
jgi:hypothetical protein